MRTCAEHGRTRLARERPKSVAQFLISTKTGGRKKSTRFSHNLVRSCSYLAFAKIGKRRWLSVNAVNTVASSGSWMVAAVPWAACASWRPHSPDAACYAPRHRSTSNYTGGIKEINNQKMDGVGYPENENAVQLERRMWSWREKMLAYGADDDRGALLRSIACRSDRVTRLGVEQERRADPRP